MKINSINFFTTTIKNTNSQNQKSFKGLWGKTTSEYIDMGSCGTIDDTYYHYYPFKDETDDEIKEATKEYDYHNSYCADSRSVVDPIPQYSDSYIEVESKLDFTKKDFEDYQKKSGSTLKRSIIERQILEKDLDVRPH